MDKLQIISVVVLMTVVTDHDTAGLPNGLPP